jgi:predicted Fe-Mo cluster-binding NifX family protein
VESKVRNLLIFIPTGKAAATGTGLAGRRPEGFMKIAIPSFGPRVSPRFDCAPNAILFTVENGKVVDRGEVSFEQLNPWQRLERLRDLNIQALICGGIDGHSEMVLQARQIRVIAWVAGEVEEAMKWFLRGELKSGLCLYPGCRRKRVRRRSRKI